jgi:hypothetical protein
MKIWRYKTYLGDVLLVTFFIPGPDFETFNTSGVVSDVSTHSEVHWMCMRHSECGRIPWRCGPQSADTSSFGTISAALDFTVRVSQRASARFVDANGGPCILLLQKDELKLENREIRYRNTECRRTYIGLIIGRLAAVLDGRAAPCLGFTGAGGACATSVVFEAGGRITVTAVDTGAELVAAGACETSVIFEAGDDVVVETAGEPIVAPKGILPLVFTATVSIAGVLAASGEDDVAGAITMVKV